MPQPRPKLAVQQRSDNTGRAVSSTSFHASAPIPSLATFRRQSQSSRYQTFPVQPPKTPKTPIEPPVPEDASAPSTPDNHGATPLPVRQLLLLAFLSLSEQTALNSIGPYLPQMVASMPGVPDGENGLYVGSLASAFALAQLSTNFLWGYASDLVGRKPVLLAGTLALMMCFCLFGLCRTYWQMVVVHVLMGLLNGNAACVPTVLGEVTDRSNQGKAFTYLPIIYSLGSITGPALGGILVGKEGTRFRYLWPNVLGAAMLGVSFVVVAIWFKETLEDSGPSPWKPAWLKRLLSSRRSEQQPLLDSPTPSNSSLAPDDDEDDDEDDNGDEREVTKPWKDLLNRTTIILLATYLVFQLSNISFNTLYPIFAASEPPTGRALSPQKIGLSLSLAGLATILFQAFLYQPLMRRIGNLGSYRWALAGFGASMLLMPWVGQKSDGAWWLYAELAVILVFKSICAVGGLSSVMLLITNSAPSHASLGTLNGVAQTLSALGRSIGPFVAGGLFSLSTGVQPKGEALAWSLFGGLALAGWALSLFIHGEGLESDEWLDEEHDEEHQEA